MIRNTTLGEVASIITGPFGSQLHMSDYVNMGIPVIMPQNIKDGTISLESIAHISEKDYLRLNRYAVNPNDIIFARRGDIEKHAFITDNNKLLCGTGCFRVRITDSSVYPLFLSFYLNRYETRRWLTSHAVGSNMPNLNTSILSAVTLDLPNFDEQVKIGNFLNNIEKKILCNKKINDNLQRQLKLMYDYWFTQFDFPDEESKPYRSSGGAMVWNDELQRDIPVGWECKTLGDLLIKNNEVFDFGKIEPTIDLSVMPSASISLQELNSSDQFTTNLFIMHEGDILFGSIRPYLKKAGIAPCNGVVAGTVHSYRTKNDEDYNFALFTLCRDSFFNYALSVSTGTKMPVINSDNILSYRVPYSKDIVKLFNEVKIKNIVCKNIQEIQRLSQLRDWLLPMLMNGQVGFKDEREEKPQIKVSGFEQWLTNQGIAARGDVDMEVLRNIYEAMDSDDK